MDRTTAESPTPADATTGRAPADGVGGRIRRDPTDEELDQYIRVRLALIHQAEQFVQGGGSIADHV